MEDSFIYIHKLNHFAVHQKLTQPCKLTVRQFKNTWWNKKVKSFFETLAKVNM